LELRPQRIKGCDRGLVGFRLNVQGDEYQPLADLLGPLAGKDKRAALPLHLGYECVTVPLKGQLLEKPRRST
jgi:hypothetical protein